MIENFIPEGFIAQHTLCRALCPDDLIFYFAENKIFLLENNHIPQGEDLKDCSLPETKLFYCFGQFKQQRCLLLPELDPTTIDQIGLTPHSVRFSHERLESSHYRLAGLACQLQYWRSTHIHCGHCGTLTEDKIDERAKFCPHCQLTSYPQLYPCIIVMVTRGPELLLARSPHFQPGIYSTLAGFIEPGESAEDAVYREVSEEVGLNIKNVRYVLSQPWPFPNSLMLGYMAEYDSGTLQIDPIEIEDAQWFKPTALPKLPSPLSISRLLIEKHLENYLAK